MIAHIVAILGVTALAILWIIAVRHAMKSSSWGEILVLAGVLVAFIVAGVLD